MTKSELIEQIAKDAGVTLHTYPILFLYQANLVDAEFIGVMLFRGPLERLAVHFLFLKI